ncbi:subtilisin-like protease 2 [Plasmodium cynomolgi strain B]|uniref:subtilisin n=1 Tax=Plasmodium cynomolgi (strain B) TaxID=1120755 RepID=K6UTL2_PLACD|nr:subtilisin-like protease 2 [Plasmodium cynomolgi strain B]GAB66644.1 subtilisin-like protease 2 [Plasmodium cynomolgi strain B]
MSVGRKSDIFSKLINHGNIENFDNLGEDEQEEKEKGKEAEEKGKEKENEEEEKEAKKPQEQAQPEQSDQQSGHKSLREEGSKSDSREKEGTQSNLSEPPPGGESPQEGGDNLEHGIEVVAGKGDDKSKGQEREKEKNLMGSKKEGEKTEKSNEEGSPKGDSLQGGDAEEGSALSAAGKAEEEEGEEEEGEEAEGEEEEGEEEEGEEEEDKNNQGNKYQLNEGENVAQEDIKTQKFDHYTIVTNSNDVLNDIRVDASDISKLSIESINIPYSEENKTVFTHQRHIVLTNKGNKKYRIVLMTKNPKFTELEDEPNEGAATNTFIERERMEKKKTPNGEGEHDNDRTNLYGGKGTLDFGKAYHSNRKGSGREMGTPSGTRNPNVEMHTAGGTGEGGIRGTINRLFSFLSFKVNRDEPVSGTGESKDGGGRDGGDGGKKGNDNGGDDRSERSDRSDRSDHSDRSDRPPRDDRTHDLYEILSADKLVDQYLLNLKNDALDKQELIFVLRGDLDLHSAYMKRVIKRSNAKFEQHIKKNFQQVDRIVYDVSSPINFLCFFVPTVFDMSNFHLLKEALLVLQRELERYMENWSFSNTYVTLDAPHVGGGESGAPADGRNDSHKGAHADIHKDAHVDSRADAHVDNRADGPTNRKARKFVKKKKKLYNGKYSFLRKFWSFDSIIAFARRMNKKNMDIEKEILNFLPKELREYSTWNLSVIRVFNAWFLAGYGNKNVKVCVIDSGVDKNHIDLMKNVYIPEYSEQYEMTEDFYDFMVKNPTDSSGHGTHVTGIVGGIANDLGMVGVAPNVTLISLRFIDGVKYGGSFHAIKAINVCILNKAPIINASWGSSKYDANIYLAVERLKYTFNGKGTVLVTAAGNESKNNDEHPLYPSSFKLPHVYSVASISKNFEISPFSNYGAKSVHIMAPGHHIYSTTPNNSYKINTGTSMAAPHVCGVNALIYSVCYNQGFIPPAEEVLDIVTRTSIKVISRSRKTINDSLVNAEAAVLTTLLGGLWMQMDCHFVKFNLEGGKKKHIPVVFSAYKKGIYETDIVMAVIPTDENSKVYGEILIPIRIVTDPKAENFKESPRNGKKMIIDENEASHDEVLSYICENALYNLYEVDSYSLVISLVLLFVAFILIILGTVVFIKRKRHSKYCDDEDHYHNIMRNSVIEHHHILGGSTNLALEMAKRSHVEKVRNNTRFSLVMGKQNACVFKERAHKTSNFENYRNL